MINMPPKTSKIVFQSIHSIIMLILIFFVIGRYGQSYYLFDLLNHFRPFFILVFLVLWCWVSLKKYSHRVWLYLLLAILFNSHMMQRFPSKNSKLPVDLHILHFNLLVDNPNHSAVLDTIRQHQPQLISFQETTPRWAKILKKELPEYRFICHVLDTPFGICAATTLTLEEEDIFFVQNPQVPSISLRTTINSNSISVVFIHPKPPFTQSFFIQRNRYLEKLTMRLQQEHNLIVIGDFNTTQWSPIYQQMSSALQLKNTLSGIQNTWPSFLIPIFQLDHILISERFHTIEAEVLSDIGSDHYPIRAKIRIPPPQ